MPGLRHELINNSVLFLLRVEMIVPVKNDDAPVSLDQQLMNRGRPIGTIFSERIAPI